MLFADASLRGFGRSCLFILAHTWFEDYQLGRVGDCWLLPMLSSKINESTYGNLDETDLKLWHGQSVMLYATLRKGITRRNSLPLRHAIPVFLHCVPSDNLVY